MCCRQPSPANAVAGSTMRAWCEECSGHAWSFLTRLPLAELSIDSRKTSTPSMSSSQLPCTRGSRPCWLWSSPSARWALSRPGSSLPVCPWAPYITTSSSSMCQHRANSSAWTASSGLPSLAALVRPSRVRARSVLSAQKTSSSRRTCRPWSGTFEPTTFRSPRTAGWPSASKASAPCSWSSPPCLPCPRLATHPPAPGASPSPTPCPSPRC
mmetsp:Transcript_6336/g.18557  ORF Transcript_6336/g.18557 Transcript_6336/m.18557 type:complete len:212 (+) Transcript_6336:3248-3883(+)